jgi:nucleoside-diphosphate-sugar epimerase
VLDGLSGLLAAGQRILSGTLPRLCYDLGRPDPATAEPAADLVAALLAGLGVPDWPVAAGPGGGDRLVQDCAAATADLGWQPAWQLPALAAATGRWYRAARAAGADPAAAGAITDTQIEQFLAAARQRPVPWAG